ncbi:NADH:ubiquinone oxidoreductase subunit K [Geomicrobium halophilum]|uniref:NADH:ubiquinone oxidoreductase subunit K n=1 Tax=Geomicrobium halophilum TaxID=549000 RepID=A0A841PR42_9BACL|nr:hypothetical protein [Geomicrobium halophilum]MBB6451367.1 NADH:ubiquinone oxidoreductase subunit K [Geomicrobium halophilum]
MNGPMVLLFTLGGFAVYFFRYRLWFKMSFCLLVFAMVFFIAVVPEYIGNLTASLFDLLQKGTIT